MCVRVGVRWVLGWVLGVCRVGVRVVRCVRVGVRCVLGWVLGGC